MMLGGTVYGFRPLNVHGGRLMVVVMCGMGMGIVAIAIAIAIEGIVKEDPRPNDAKGVGMVQPQRDLMVREGSLGRGPR